jgi:hypothetical protein
MPRAAWVLSLAAMLVSVAALAEDARLAAPMRTILSFKVLTFDRNIGKGRDALRIGVVAQKGKEESEQAAGQVVAAVKKVQHMRVSGLKIEVSLLAAADGPSLEKLVEKSRSNVLLYTQGTDTLMDKVCKLGARKILMGTSESHQIKRCAAFAIIERDGKPKILINLKHATAQGAAFDDRLLKSAEVTR